MNDNVTPAGTSCTFLCDVCQKESPVVESLPIEHPLARGLPVPPPGHWFAISCFAQNRKTGRTRMVQLVACSEACRDRLAFASVARQEAARMGNWTEGPDVTFSPDEMAMLRAVIDRWDNSSDPVPPEVEASPGAYRALLKKIGLR